MYKEISEIEFSENTRKKLFGNLDFDFKFGKINNFYFSWKSDLILPKIIQIEPNIIAIGIDLNFAVVDTKSDLILLNLILDFYFCEVLCESNYLFISTELQIIIVDFVDKLKVLKKIDLPDVYSSIFVSDNQITVTLIDGQNLIFDISSNFA